MGIYFCKIYKSFTIFFEFANITFIVPFAYYQLKCKVFAVLAYLCYYLIEPQIIKGVVGMKIKRAFLILILSLTMVIFLTSCIMIPRYKHYDIDLEKTSTIEIYDLRNSESHYSDFLETEAPV